jgi:hypothetical protein
VLGARTARDAALAVSLTEEPGQDAGLMRVGTIVEVAFARLRLRWRSTLLLAVVFAAPAALFTAAAAMRFDAVVQQMLADGGADILEQPLLFTAGELERLTAAVAWYLVATLVAGALGSVGAVAIASAILGRDQAWQQQLRMALRIALGRTPSVIAFMLVTSAVVVAIVVAGLVAMTLAVSLLSASSIDQGGPGVFVALIVGVGLVVVVAYLTMRWAAAYPVMAVERAGWREALARSWDLSADNVWRIGAVVIFGALVTAVGAAAITQLLGLVLVDLLAIPAGVDPLLAETLVMAVVTVLLAPLSPALLAVLYTDLRTRRGAGPSRPDPARPPGPRD